MPHTSTLLTLTKIFLSQGPVFHGTPVSSKVTRQAATEPTALDMNSTYLSEVSDSDDNSKPSVASDYEDFPEFVVTKPLIPVDSVNKKKNVIGSSITKKRANLNTHQEIQKEYRKKLMERFRKLTKQFTIECSEQVVVVIVNLDAEDSRSRFNAIGSHPLNRVIRKIERKIMQDLRKTLHFDHKTDTPERDYQSFKLPSLVFNGLQTPVNAMNLNQLRTLIPLIIKHSTSRLKPFYGEESKKPCWWPDCVPWKNIRYDSRSANEKRELSWKDALRQVVVNCYKYHDRLDLLQGNEEKHNPTIVGQKQFALLQTGKNLQGLIDTPHYHKSLEATTSSKKTIELKIENTECISLNNAATMENSHIQIKQELEHESIDIFDVDFSGINKEECFETDYSENNTDFPLNEYEPEDGC